MSEISSAQAAILELLHQRYEAILPIEAAWHIRLIEGDMRPRIEYFHDAVRAFSQTDLMLDEAPRLSVEHIAHDVTQLRAIQDKPLGNLNRATQKSASDAVMVLDGKPAPSANKTPPIKIRNALKEHYQHYAAFFSALLCEAADRDYKARCDEHEETLGDIGLIEEMLKQLIDGRLNQAQAQEALSNIAHDALREQILALLSRKKMTERDAQEAKAASKKLEEKLRKDQENLDERHLQMLTSKLLILQESKDIVQGLMKSGLNLAGKFLAQAGQSAGAGRDQGVGF